MKNKSGVSMFILIITIIVTLIIVSTITVTIGSALNDAKLVEFGRDINVVSDSNIEYYIMNSSYALKDDTVYTLSEIKSKLSSNKVKDFEEEIIKNGDSDSSFRYLDITKLNLQNVKRGLQTNGNNDVYIISYPTENIYYLDGIKVDNKYYFSLANISDNTKINNKIEEKVNALGISYTKDKKGYTNTLGLTINANIENGEKLYLKLEGNNETALTTTLGNNVIKMDTPFKAILDNNTYNIDATTNASPNYISVIKKSSSNSVIGTVNIPITNYDNVKPEIDTTSATLTLGEEKNIFSFSASDNKSGIRQIRYEYINRFDSASQKQSYYTNQIEINNEYMKKVAKVKNINLNEDLSVELPRDVSDIVFCVVDGAGNYSNIISSKTYELSTDILPYVGVSLDSKTTQDIYVINFAIFYDDTINSLDVSISSDGKKFGTVNNIASSYLKKNNNITTASISFNSIDTNTLYVKTKVNGKTVVTVVDKLDISDYKYATSNKKITADNLSITIPVGFAPVVLKSDGAVDKILPKEKWNEETFSDSVINQGVVVVDKEGNEYVWIPVGSDIEYSKRNSNVNNGYTVTADEVEDDSLPSGINSEEYQITKYGGFYVARYEAGLPDSQTTDTLMATKTFSATVNNKTDIGKAQSKANKIVWNRINYTNAKIVAEAVISNSYVQTGLLTGTQWDTMCKFIEKDGVNVLSNSVNWGNYKNKINYTVNDVYYRVENADVVYIKGSYTKSEYGYLLLPTGIFAKAVEGANPKNICDVAGNVWEWTAEKVKEVKNGQAYVNVGNMLLRGGGFNNNGSNCATYRDGNDAATTAHPNVGFRFVLYIK